MSKLTRSVISIGLFAMAVACTPTKEVEYVLNYEVCKQMASNPDHPYWKQPIVVQGCEMIIYDVEVGEGNEMPPPMEDVELPPEDEE